MAKAKPNPTRSVRFADTLRDPETRQSFRAARLGSPATFIDGKAIDTRRRRIPSLAKLLHHDIVSTGDLIGRAPAGEFFVLITVSQRTFQALCAADERLADREPDDEDQGEDEMPPGRHTGPGDEDDAEEHDEPEEDDPAAGNIDEPHFSDSYVGSMPAGENSLGWSDNESQAPGLLAEGCGFGDREEDADERAEDEPPEPRKGRVCRSGVAA